MLSRTALLTTLAATCALAVPAAASASTAAIDGADVRVQGAPGENNKIYVSVHSASPPTVRLEDDGATLTPGNGCRRNDVGGSAVLCPAPAGKIRIATADGNDLVSHLIIGSMHWGDDDLHVDLGEGDDEFIGTPAREVVSGGGGNDELEPLGGDDHLDGGDGDDVLEGHGGADTMLGGPGNDRLDGDRQEAPAADLIDGGPGSDHVSGWAQPSGQQHPPIALTLDGQPNDGRPGEGDDVRDVEAVVSQVSGKIALGDAPDTVDLWSNLDGGASTITTAGGGDRVVTGSNSETIDTGAGDDTIDAGYGNDSIVAGPGRDTVSSDQVSPDCSVFKSCTSPTGDDTVDLRDGEADTLTCGAGNDTVQADPFDNVAGDCETVTRAGTVHPPDPKNPNNNNNNGPGDDRHDGPVGPAGRLALAGSQRLRQALRAGLRVTVPGTASTKVTATVDKSTARRLGLGRKATVVARGAGAGTVKLRFTMKARKRLARVGSVKLTIRAGSLTKSVTLRK
jgi:Ca2+-binding RTX toxin-like protein